MVSLFEDKMVANNALDHSHKLQQRAIEVGFKWANIDDVMLKVEEELLEVKEALLENDAEHLKEEIGDLLFCVSKIATYVEVCPSEALEGCNQKFLRRFKFMEEYMTENYEGDFGEQSLTDMMKGWNEAKKNCKPA